MKIRAGLISFACVLSMAVLSGCEGSSKEINLPALPTLQNVHDLPSTASGPDDLDTPGAALQEGASVFHNVNQGDFCEHEGDVGYSRAGQPVRCSVIKCDYVLQTVPRWRHLC